MKKGGLEYRDEEVYEAVQFIGYFRELMNFDRIQAHIHFLTYNYPVLFRK